VPRVLLVGAQPRTAFPRLTPHRLCPAASRRQLYAAGSCTSFMLTEDRPAAAQTPEADRRHHRRPCRGRGHRLVGRRLNEGRVLLLGYVPLLPLSLQGTVELQDGHQGCCGGATGRRLRSECSGAPSERLRRFGSDARPACSTILCIGRGQQTAKSWHVGMLCAAVCTSPTEKAMHHCILHTQ
jgi:hypothetical protein